MQQKSTLTRFQVEGDAAADYQQFLVPAIFERWAAMLIGVADLQEGDQSSTSLAVPVSWPAPPPPGSARPAASSGWTSTMRC